jgi:hypothetical protein
VAVDLVEAEAASVVEAEAEAASVVDVVQVLEVNHDVS